MSRLGNFERYVAKRPWPFIGVILAVTLVMAYFTTLISFESGEDSFAPDTEEGKANIKVRNVYGSPANTVGPGDVGVVSMR